MERDERIGLRLSIAMHVTLLVAFQTSGGSAEQNVPAMPVQLVVLPVQSSKPEGEQPTDAADDCGVARSRRSTPGVELNFKIAKAPLETALRSFGDQTGLEYAVRSKLLAYRRGTAVHGFYTPVEAADRLLDGTGLCGYWFRGGLIINTCGTAARKKRGKPSFGLRLASPADPCVRGGFRLEVR